MKSGYYMSRSWDIKLMDRTYVVLPRGQKSFQARRAETWCCRRKEPEDEQVMVRIKNEAWYGENKIVIDAQINLPRIRKRR